MTGPVVRAIRLTPERGLPRVLLGPSLGTSVVALWEGVAGRLADEFDVVGWDLPGHGHSPAPTEPFDMVALAAAVAAVGGEIGAPYLYAGCSLGGCIGLQLLLDHSEDLRAAVLVCTAAKIGETSAWLDRAALVRRSGTPVMVTGSAERWFAPGFMEREPGVATRLLDSLQHADAEGYAACCESLADFDVRDRLAEITQPVTAVVGAEDQSTPTRGLEHIATSVSRGKLAVIDGVSHLAPAEAPERVAVLIRETHRRQVEGWT